MSSYNFASRKAALAKAAAGNFNVDYDEDGKVVVAPTSGPRPTVALPPTETPPVGRGRGRFRSYDDAGADSSQNPPLGGTATGTASPQSAPPVDPVVSKMKQEMIAWIKAKIENPSTPPAKAGWFSDGPISRQTPKFIPLSAFFQICEKLLAGKLGPAGASQWASKEQQAATGLGAGAESADAPQGSDRIKWLKDSGLDGSSALPRAVQDQSPQAIAFANNFADKLNSDPHVRELLHINSNGPVDPDVEQVISDSLYSAFGPGERGQRNDISFFLSANNLKYLPSAAKQALQSAPGVGENMYLLGDKSPQGREVTQKAREFLAGQGGDIISKRIQAMSLFSTGDPAKMQEATKLDPEVASFDPHQVSNDMMNRAYAEVGRRYKEFKLRGKGRNIGKATETSNGATMTSLDESMGGEDGGTKGDSIHGGASPLDNMLREEGADDTDLDPADPNSLDRRKDLMNDQSNLSQKHLTDVELEHKSREVASGLQDVAKKVREAGRDISAYMKKAPPTRTTSKQIPLGKPDEYWKDGRPGFPPSKDQDKNREDRVGKAMRFRIFTDSLAQELELMARNTAEGRQRLKSLIGGIYNRDTGKFNARRTGVPEGMPLLGDHQATPEIKGHPEHGPAYQNYSDYQGSSQGSDMSDFTNVAREDLNKLLGDDQIIGELKKRVASLMNNKLSRAGNALQGVTSAKQIKDELRQDFGVWGPFMLLDPVRKKFDTATRRILTDVLPIRTEYMTGAGKHGQLYPVLFHAVRGDLHKLPVQRGWNPKDQAAAPSGGEWHPNDVMKQINEWKQKASKNLSMKGIERRWQKGQQAKSHLQAMKSRLLMMKVASVDLVNIDMLIEKADRYINAQYQEFFRLLGV